MKTLIRAALLLVGAAAFCVALSSVASADVVTPRSAYQPASVDLLKAAPATADMSGPAKAESDKAQAEVAGDPNKLGSMGEVVQPTPAPEQVVRPARPPVLQPDSARVSPLSLVDLVVSPLRMGLQQMQATLGRVVTACEAGFGTGTGGPVVVLAVLALAIPFIRRRVIATWGTTDEDLPEFLFAGELTPPG